MNELIKGQDISFSYDDTHLSIDKINFSIKEGEFVAVLGSNGSGKSTLAKILDFLYLPDKGHLYFEGVEVTEENRRWMRRKIGYVFQNPETQFVSSNVYEEIAYALANYGYDDETINKNVSAAIKKLKLQGKEDRDPKTLSGGEKQKVALASILALKPKTIILDEALSMLDQSTKAELIELLKNIKEERKTTVIYITQTAEEALIADRIMVMDKGQIVRIGDMREILTDADFLSKYKLLPPCVTRIALSLEKEGIKFKYRPLTPYELGDSICD